MNDKTVELNVMMQDVTTCKLCCSPGCGIAEGKLLTNLIAQEPDAPRYGKVPSRYTDWATRLDAKIAMVLQDWGSENAALDLRYHYEKLIKQKGMSCEEAWCETIRNRPKPSPTHKRITSYLTESAEREGLKLPRHFCDGIYFTNAVLCFQKGDFSRDSGIDLPKSIRNCCEKKKFLSRQLKIVRPKVVVSLGGWALKALGVRVGIEAFIREVRASSPYGYQAIQHEGLPLNLVPALHPTAHAKPGQLDFHEQQIETYRCIWKTLSHLFNLSGAQLVTACFPGAR